jgi:hypothetical protein
MQTCSTSLSVDMVITVAFRALQTSWDQTPSNHDATMRGQKRKARRQRKGKKKQPRLSAHINPWTINSSQRRKQSQNTPTVASSTPTASSVVTVKLPP